MNKLQRYALAYEQAQNDHDGLVFQAVRCLNARAEGHNEWMYDSHWGSYIHVSAITRKGVVVKDFNSGSVVFITLPELISLATTSEMRKYLGQTLPDRIENIWEVNG